MKVFAAILAFSAVAGSLQAQTVDLDSLSERLSQEGDIATLRRREFSLTRPSATSAEALLERGMVKIRLHQISQEDSDAKDARDIFERAIKRLPDDPRPHYGLALARLGGPLVRVPSPGGVLKGIVVAQSVAEVLKRDPMSLAKRDLKRALEIDPTFVSAAVQLANVSLETRDRDNMQAAAAALRALVHDQRGGARAAVALSEVEAALGNVKAAEAAADAATTLSTGSETAASVAHARAVALLRQPGKEEEGARVYFEGLENLTPDAAEAYYESLRPVLNEREQGEWSRADLAQKREWLQKFWNIRAATAGITVGDRLAEHYSRLAVAHDKYRRKGKRGSAPGGSLLLEEYKDDALPFDDRGVIYVRHGAPVEIVQTTNVDLRPNETWVYNANGKNQLYHFMVLRDGTDFRLVDDLLAALDPSTAGIPADAAQRLLRDRQAYEPRYAALATRFDNLSRARGGFSSSDLSFTARETIKEDMRQQALIGLSTDSDQPDFDGALPFYYDLLAFKGGEGKTDVTAAIAIPGESLASQEMGTQFVYSIEASLIFVDTINGNITRKDSTYTYLSSHRLGEYEHLRMTVDLTVPRSGAGIHRVVIRDRARPGVGQLYGGRADLKNFAGDSLMVSDVVLGETEDGAWQRGIARLGLVPPRQFEERKPLKLFYEIYNLPADAQYRTEISMASVAGATGFGRIKRLFGGGDGKVQLQFEGTAPTTQNRTLQELKEVTAEVKPGKYKVTVKVTNLETQATARSETLFIVSEKSKKK